MVATDANPDIILGKVQMQMGNINIDDHELLVQKGMKRKGHEQLKTRSLVEGFSRELYRM
jgi:hypothetical protein